MDFAAKLRDVEQQISRVTGVVQLHVRLAAASRGSVEQESAVPELVESVEPARRELNAAAEELLALYRRSVDPEEEYVGTDPQVKSEILDLPDNNEAVKSSVILGVGTQEMKMEVNSTGLQDADSRKADESATSTPKDSSQVQQVVADGGDGRFLSFNTGFLKYTIFAHYAKKRRKAKNGRMDAEVVLSGMSSQDIDKWRQFVREYAPCAHFKVLAYLRNGKVARKQIELFSDATMLAVSLLITRDKCRDRYWLLQFAEELSDILHAAIVPPVVQMLGHVETSHIELVEYCISNFDDSLEDMSEYARLVERHRLVEKKPMLPFLISLLRKFICDCVDYRLRHDANIRTPRTETHWARFHEIGVILANWIDDVSTIDIPLEVINASTPTERLQRFNEQFPDRIPEAFLVWRCVSSAEQKMIGFKQGVQPANVAGTREGGTDVATQQRSTVLPFATPTPPFVWGKQLAQRKRTRSSCVETDTDSNKRIMLSQKSQRTSESGNCVGDGYVVNHDSRPVNLSEATHATSQLPQSLPKKITLLNRYLLAAKEAEEGIKNMIEGEAANENPGTGDSAFSDTIVISKWTTAVKEFLNPAIAEFIAKLAGGPVDAEVEAAFAEAIVIAVTLITTRENNKNFKRPWILQFVNLLDKISDMHEKQKRSSQALSSIHESRNALLVHCDNRFQDYLAEIAQFVNKHEEKAKEEVGIGRLQEIIEWLAIKFGTGFYQIGQKLCCKRHFPLLRGWTPCLKHSKSSTRSFRGSYQKHFFNYVLTLKKVPGQLLQSWKMTKYLEKARG
uniref:Uncharacterized protein n=1 Tax=Phytophthora fragariae TaxID=53985 RepID=A0A6A3FNW9_9STRA|nr:hypothetical protein PF009_g2640 [Phytophthora fragariae]